MTQTLGSKRAIFSIDVEDWFHILDTPATPDISQWDSMDLTVEKNFIKLLDIIQEKDIKVSCFFLGWIAQKKPDLVKEALNRGHEIGSHGYSHTLVYKMDQNEFYQDVKKSKDVLEDITGSEISGYRAPGWSVTEDTPWYFDSLIKAGFKYSSSIFPANRAHGGMKSGSLVPYAVNRDGGQIIEFPMTMAKQFGKPVCFFGGGYLRLFPYFLIKRKAYQVLKENRPLIFYTHPREIDPDHPRLNMNLKRTFKSYVNLKSTRGKITRILDDFQFMTFQQYIDTHLQDLI